MLICVYYTSRFKLGSDRLGLHQCVSMKCLKKRSKPIIREIWWYSHTDFDCAAELVGAIEWEEILPDDVESYRAD